MALIFSSSLYAEELKTNDGSNDYILQIDNNGLGYDNNDPNSQDQTSSYLLTGNVEAFDSGAGDDNTTSGSGTNYRMKTGLQPTFEANVAEVSAFTATDPVSGFDFYNKLIFEIDPNGNSTAADGTLFAVQISTDIAFGTYQYINPTNFQPDLITNSDLSVYYAPCAQTASTIGADATRWDCGTVGGLIKYIENLLPNTIYYARIVAMNGDFTNSEPGPAATATTGALILSFSLSTNSTTFGSVVSGSAYTASADLTLTSTTNWSDGYTVNIVGQGDGSSTESSLYSASRSISILSTQGNLSSSLNSNGYGSRAIISSSAPTTTISTMWDETQPGRDSSYVGQILRTLQSYYSSTAPSLSTGDEIISRFGLTIAPSLTSSNDYNDQITFTMGVNP